MTKKEQERAYMFSVRLLKENIYKYTNRHYARGIRIGYGHKAHIYTNYNEAIKAIDILDWFEGGCHGRGILNH